MESLPSLVLAHYGGTFVDWNVLPPLLSAQEITLTSAPSLTNTLPPRSNGARRDEDVTAGVFALLVGS